MREDAHDLTGTSATLWSQTAITIVSSRSYCERPGHNEQQCFIQHPDKAPTSSKAPTRALNHLYEQNLERLQR